MRAGLTHSSKPLARFRLALLSSAAGLLLALPAGAQASCVIVAGQDPLDASEVVLVGTVASTANGGRWATVTVEEIWKGPDIPATVVVHGGVGGDAVSSVDRTYEVGARYLLTLNIDPQGQLTDSVCSATSLWDESLAASRPAGARGPTADGPAEQGFDLAGILVPAGVALLVALGLLGAGLLARGRHSG